MTPYNDLYIRSTLRDPGTIPHWRVGMNSCPDIVPYGIMPVNDPDRFFVDNFGRDVGKNIEYNADNYIYLRGKNLSDGPQTGKMYAYYVPSGLLLYPSTWRENVLYTSSQVDHVVVEADASQTPFAAPQPFVWKQVPFPPSNHHYCLISRVVTDEHPNPLPDILTYTEFIEWLAGTGGIGLRNMRMVWANSPEILFACDYDQKEEAGLMDVLITAKGAPIGSEVWFSSGTPLPDGKVLAIPPTKVTQDGQTWGTQVYIPAGWRTTINGAYRSNGGTPRADFKISLRIQYTPEVGSRLYKFGADLEDLPYGEFHMLDRKEKVYREARTFYRERSESFQHGPVRPVLLGSVSVEGSDAGG